jgi:hypothetical protein
MNQSVNSRDSEVNTEISSFLKLGILANDVLHNVTLFMPSYLADVDAEQFQLFGSGC